MPRPRLQRHTCVRPKGTIYKPRGIPVQKLKFVTLTHEETESLWLVDYKQLEQVDAAKHMKTSQSTFQRILKSARQKVSAALIDGKAIQLEHPYA